MALERNNQARTLFLLLVALCSILAARTLWVASRTEAGLEVLAEHWRRPTIGVFSPHKPLAERSPSRQAKFWINEVDRLIPKYRRGQELAMGAAMVLHDPDDSVNPRVRSEYLRQDTEFWNLADQRCLQHAAYATQFGSSNVSSWRLRAMLLFYEPSTMVDGKRVRSPNWYSILQECKRNDKENGQYDYLAALHFWETSARYDYETDTLVIHDLERFERGNTCFQDGLGKTIVATDIHHLMSAAAALVGKSVLPAREHERAVRNCVPELSYALPRLLAMWRGNQAKRLEKRGDVREAMRVHRQTLHFVEQFARGNGMADVLFRSIGRRNAASSIRKLAQEHGDLFPSVDQRELTAIIHMEVLNARLYRIAEGKIYKTRPTGSTAVLNSTVAGYVLPESALTLLAIVILGVATARVFGVSTPPTIGALGAIVTMSAALSISFVVFGFAPAEIVNEEQQAWSFTLLIVCSPILLLAIGAWFWFRRSRFRWGLRSLFLLMIAIGLALAAWRVIDPKQEAFDTMPFRLSVPDVRMSQLEKQLSVELTYRTLYQHPWIHALLQWAAYHGPISAVLFWTVLATVFTGMKLRRNYDVDDRPVAMRDQIANLLSSTSRPAAAIGLVVLCAYFILAVSAVRDFDAKFQWRMAELRHAEAYWSQLELEMEHAQADDQQMKRLSKSVDAEMERLER